jgi:hypothetical protein
MSFFEGRGNPFFSNPAKTIPLEIASAENDCVSRLYIQNCVGRWFVEACHTIGIFVANFGAISSNVSPAHQANSVARTHATPISSLVLKGCSADRWRGESEIIVFSLSHKFSVETVWN